MAVIQANTSLTLTVPAGFRLQFGTPVSGTCTVTLPDRVLTENLTDGEGLGPYQADASVTILSTVASSCYTIRRDGVTAILQGAHLPQVPYLPGVSVLIGESAAGSAVPAAWQGSAYSFVVSGGGLSAKAKFDAMKIKPVGFDYYSLFTDMMYNISGTATTRAANLAYIAATGANLVRVALSGFSASDYTTRIHNFGGLMPDTVQDSNLTAKFISDADAMMGFLAAYNLGGLICAPWAQSTIATAFGETNAVAYGSTTSKTAIYSQSFVSWICTRYKNHPALKLISFYNEPVTDSTGVTGPTVPQFAAFLTALAAAAKAAKPDILTTSDLTAPIIDLAKTRETIEQSVARYRQIFAGLDVYNLHIYADGYNWMGHNSLDLAAAPNIYYSGLGYEGTEALMQAYDAMARADNKPLIAGEFGVTTDNEADDPGGPNAVHVSDKKKWRLARSVVPYTDAALFWNVQQTAGAPGNQTIWLIDPGSTTSRAAQFAAIATAFNNGKPAARRIGGAVASQRSQQRPRFAMRCPNRSAGYNVRFTTTAAHGSATGYSLALWVNLTGQLNNAEVLVDFRGSGNTSGLVMIANLVANTQGFYTDSRYASGSAGASNNILPDVALSEWNHVVFMHRSLNVNGTTVYATEVWLNGTYWLSIAATALPATIPTGTTAYVVGNSGNGVPAKMQDVALYPGAMSPEEIWAHMRGDVSARSLLHVRALEDGTFADVSKNAVALTVSGVVMSYE